jgi:hypothetical protein
MIGSSCPRNKRPCSEAFLLRSDPVLWSGLPAVLWSGLPTVLWSGLPAVLWSGLPTAPLQRPQVSKRSEEETWRSARWHGRETVPQPGRETAAQPETVPQPVSTECFHHDDTTSTTPEQAVFVVSVVLSWFNNALA